MSDAWTERLSEYLDEELASEQRTALETHLTGCAACRQELAGLRRVVRELDTAPDSEPRRDLWPGLAARLGEVPSPALPSQQRRWWPLALAAGLTLVMASAWILQWRDASVEPGPPPVAGVERTPDAVGAYRQAADEWRELLAERSLPAEVDETLRAELTEFDQAVEETLAALDERPEDAELRSYLVRTLRAQVRFLARVEASAKEVS